jgi:hypothetical protein
VDKQLKLKNICSLFTISLSIELSATIDISDAAITHSLKESYTLGSCTGTPQPLAMVEHAYIINMNFMVHTMTELIYLSKFF